MSSLNKPWGFAGEKIAGASAPSIGLGPKNEADCIEYYDWPLIWVERDENGRLFLLYWLDRFLGQTDRYAAFLLAEDVVQSMRSRAISIMDGLRQCPLLYIIDEPIDGPLEFTLTTLCNIPARCLPNEGVSLCS